MWCGCQHALHECNFRRCVCSVPIFLPIVLSPGWQEQLIFATLHTARPTPLLARLARVIGRSLCTELLWHRNSVVIQGRSGRADPEPFSSRNDGATGHTISSVVKTTGDRVHRARLCGAACTFCTRLSRGEGLVWPRPPLEGTSLLQFPHLQSTSQDFFIRCPNTNATWAVHAEILSCESASPSLALLRYS